LWYAVLVFIVVGVVDVIVILVGLLSFLVLETRRTTRTTRTTRIRTTPIPTRRRRPQEHWNNTNAQEQGTPLTRVKKT
jgi:hypothetical protein